MKKKLGEILVSSGVVTDADIDSALSDQSAGEPSRLGDLLVASGKLSSVQLAQALSEQYDVPFVELPPLPQAVLDLVPLELQRQYRFVPLRSDGTELTIAMADLSDRDVLPILESTWSKVHLAVAGGDEIDALHNTLSGIFRTEARPVAPALTDDFFGSIDVEPEPESSIPSIKPVSAPPRAEDLFGDLNLESGRTGITTTSTPEESVTVVEDLENSGPVITGVRAGTGPLLDMLAREGTGPVIDTPFFKGAAGMDIAPIPDLPFASTPSMNASSGTNDSLPDWLAGQVPKRSEPPVAHDSGEWTGALDHLAPSKLVLGLTRALLARGIVTESEILAALGQKK